MTVKVDPQRGISDVFRVIRKGTNPNTASDTDITSKLGKPINASYDIQESSEREAHVNSGADMTANTDTLVTVTGEANFRVQALDIFRLMGRYSESSGTWTVDLTDVLPVFELKLQIEKGGKDAVLHIYNVKFGQGEISVDKQGFMTASFSYEACLSDSNNFIEIKDNTTLTKPTPEGYSKRGFDTEFAIGGNAVGSGQSFTFTYDRDLDSDKGIEPNDGRPKRVPTQLIEQMKNFNASGQVDITDLQVFQETLDTSSYPLTIQDRRTTKTLKLGLAQSTAGSIEWTGAKMNALGGELSNDADKRTISTESNATGATITGST